MTEPDPTEPVQAPAGTPVNPNGMALAALRPKFVMHPPEPGNAAATQYVLTRTILGEEALTWSEPWVPGLFSLTEIMDWFPTALPLWAQGLQEALQTHREFSPMQAAAWEVVRRTDPDGWTTVTSLPPHALPNSFEDSFSQVPLSEESYGTSIHGVVRWRDPVLLAKDARARKLLGTNRDERGPRKQKSKRRRH
jgi:hypothetical protein